MINFFIVENDVKNDEKCTAGARFQPRATDQSGSNPTYDLLSCPNYAQRTGLVAGGRLEAQMFNYFRLPPFCQYHVVRSYF